MTHSSTPGLPASTLIHSAFYRFVPVAAPEALAASLRALTTELLGSILVAQEGINGMVAGAPAALAAFEAVITDASYFDGMLRGMDFKHSGCSSAPFARMKVHHREQIVALGVPTSVLADGGTSGINVTPRQWRELLDDPDVVVIDNRNSFEFRLGRFRSAIDPQVGNFREFSEYVRQHVPGWQAAGKRVAMYCTGGIRCEKTSASMRDAGIELYQLEGGILNYFQAMPDAQRDWEGECFVFDNRIALDTRLQETATTAEDVYVTPADAWRLARARRLDDAG